MYLRPWVRGVGLGGLGACPCGPTPLVARPVMPMPRPAGMGRLGAGIPISVESIREGRLGTRDTIRKMGQLAVAAAHDPTFVAWVRGQVADLPSKDYKGEGQRIFDIVHQHVRYTRDPTGLEVVQDPRAVLFQDGTGDCDEHATTIAAMAMALGHHAAFRTVAANYEMGEDGKPKKIDEWSHVYALVGIEDGYAKDGIAWYPADSTQRSATFGWEPPEDRVWMKKDWRIF